MMEGICKHNRIEFSQQIFVGKAGAAVVLKRNVLHVSHHRNGLISIGRCRLDGFRCV